MIGDELRAHGVAEPGLARARVLLAVDTPLRALGLKAALRDVPAVRVAWVSHAVEAALADARRVLPQVILADLHLPGGGAAALCRALLPELPETRVVILAPDAGESALLEAVIAGAAGYVVDDGTPERVVRAVEQAARGETALAHASVDSLLEWIRRHHADPPPAKGPLDMLSPRERQTLALVAEGRTNRMIAAALCLSPLTVKTNMVGIFKKLHARNRAEAAAIYARESAAETGGVA